MCKVLSVSRSGFYSWLKQAPSKRELANQALLSKIKFIYKYSRNTYGSPRIAKDLQAMNIKVSRVRVARLMRMNNIKSVVKRKYVVTTDSNHTYNHSPNLLQRNFTSNIPGNVWVSDITYIRTGQGWLYLTTVIDLFDRKIIGWALSKSMRTGDTSVKALNMALNNRAKDENLIFHSDRGVQYACDEFRELLKEKDIAQSMSRKGNCWDNAVAESFFKTIKTECIYRYSFKTTEIASRYIFDYIEVWYNRLRRHSALNYATPLEIENKYYLNEVA